MFNNCVKLFECMLHMIKLSTKEIQTRYHNISDYRGDFKMLIYNVRVCNNTSKYALRDCLPDSRHISLISNKLLSLSYISGVIKILNDNVISITTFEQAAYSCLLLTKDANIIEE